MENNSIGKAIIGITLLVVIGAVVWGVSNSGNTSSEKTVNVSITEQDHYRGNMDAEVTLLEYSDFQCPACRAYDPVVTEVLQAYTPEQVRFVYRHYPLTSIHKNAVISAQASEAAANQGKFWEMKDLLFTNQSDWEDESDPREMFRKYAEELGLNIDVFMQDLDSDDVKNRVQEDLSSAQALGLRGTPTFILNGTIIQNPQSVDAFKALIDEALAQ